MTDNTEGFISLSKIVYKATLPPTDLETVRFILKLFQIVKKQAIQENNKLRNTMMIVLKGLNPFKILKMTKPNLKLIAVSTENYLELKRRGQTADSFNDVITELLKVSKKVTGDQPITIGRTQHPSQEVISH